ncbi:hypothetical protein M406DRAFT_259903 [Cryphonectria parasitica EP155]|uniref:F-box domain-containing protein n=1 Tax=Cryphonectria parasitica (strain ATCC 38755 / EP155) TaxID=660469 RepID=A0A9P5CNF9_CRYP1|nr:uncharacterized protein M406DRAFT_259903 [Cryphonectria parasitica EP155]KAF3764282.1 hypothetical protein M406DRAFT_259903 [Cryphonectria parasitica EP155]
MSSYDEAQPSSIDQIASGLDRLAPELTRHIVQYVGKGDLKSVRLVNRGMENHAASEMFRDVFLSPGEDMMERWNNIVQDERLRHLPWHVTIQTREKLETDHKYDEFPDNWEQSLRALERLPNVSSIKIVFTEECAGEESVNAGWSDEYVGEFPEQREEMLVSIFGAIERRASNGENRKIRKLSIVHLQNYPLPEFTKSDLFRGVMDNLHELHLMMVQEYNEHGPDHDYTKVELRTFLAHLCADWLSPISQNLKALSLHHLADNWGPLPAYFNPCDLSFPNLETLSLRYYTPAHDDSLDWILAQKSIKRLIIHRGMIAARLNIRNENVEGWQVKTHDWYPMEKYGDDARTKSYGYDGKWSDFFARIADGLPNLIGFSFNGLGSDAFDSHEVGDPVSKNEEYNAFAKRYVVFDDCTLPTHWPEAEYDGDLHCWLGHNVFPNLHKLHLDEDREGLDSLLEKCRVRAKRC